jgi:hypothetical protein
MQSSEVTYWITSTYDSPANRFWYRDQRPFEVEYRTDTVTYATGDQAFRMSTWGTTNQNYFIKLKYRNISNTAYREIQNCVLLAQGSLRSFMLDLTTFSPQGQGFAGFNANIDFTVAASYSSNVTAGTDIVLTSATSTGTLKQGDILLSTELFGYGIINYVDEDIDIEFTGTDYEVKLARAFRPLPDSSPAGNQSAPYTVTLARYIPVSLVDNGFSATRTQNDYWNCEVEFVVRDTRL